MLNTSWDRSDAFDDREACGAPLLQAWTGVSRPEVHSGCGNESYSGTSRSKDDKASEQGRLTASQATVMVDLITT